MFWKRKPKERTLAEIHEDLRPAFAAKNDKKVGALLEELFAAIPEDRDKAGGYISWSILSGIEFQMQAVLPYIDRFLAEFPTSLMPIKAELAGLLANQERYDEATQLSREYLRLVRDGGLLQKLDTNNFVRMGVTRAFLTATSAYTMLGARSYSRRLLAYALRQDLDPNTAPALEKEHANLREELQDPGNKRLNDGWEAFFATGAARDHFISYCEHQKYPMMARRVELIETNMRFNADFRVDENEFFLLVREGQTPNGKPVQLLA